MKKKQQKENTLKLLFLTLERQALLDYSVQYVSIPTLGLF